MAIKKQFSKSKPVCKVTFSLPAGDAKKVTVIGTFNNWNTEEVALKKSKEGVFKGSIDLESGKSYEFKYIVDGDFVNDDEADAYVWNDFAGSENGVINA